MFILASNLVSSIIMYEKESYKKINNIQSLQKVIRFGIVICFLLFLPKFGETCLWMSGAINYLWMSVIVLFMLKFDQRGNKTGTLVMALVSGFTNEVTSGMLIVYFFLKLILKKDAFCKFFLFKILLLIPGMIVVVFAPGNFNRSALSGSDKAFSISGAIKGLKKTGTFLVSGGYLLIISVILICIMFFLLKKGFDQIKDALIFFLTSIAGMFGLTLSGGVITRAEFLSIIFLSLSFFCCICELHRYILEKKETDIDKAKKFRRLFGIAMGGLAIVASAVIMVNLYFFLDCAKKDHEYISMIEEAALREEDISISNVKYDGYSIFYPEEIQRNKQYTASWQSLYYGIKIKVIQ